MLMMMMMPTQIPMNDFVQSKAHEEAMGGLIKGGYIKTCTAGNLLDIVHEATQGLVFVLPATEGVLLCEALNARADTSIHAEHFYCHSPSPCTDCLLPFLQGLFL